MAPTSFALVNDAVVSIAVPVLVWTCASLLSGRHLGGELLGPWKRAVYSFEEWPNFSKAAASFYGATSSM